MNCTNVSVEKLQASTRTVAAQTRTAVASVPAELIVVFNTCSIYYLQEQKQEELK